MLTKQDIEELFKTHNKTIFGFGVKRIGIFGSYARSEQTSDSDIDFLVEFEEGRKNFDNFMDLAFFLRDLFQVKTELITPESLAVFMKEKIMKETEYVLSA